MKPLELIEQGRFLGEEFVLWLWMRGTAEGGTSGEANDHSACFVDDAVMLAAEHGEVKELSLRSGIKAGASASGPNWSAGTAWFGGGGHALTCVN